MTPPRRPGAVSRVAGIFLGESFTVRTVRAPRQLLLPNQFQKLLNSPLLIFFCQISEEDQPVDPGAFLHEVVFHGGVIEGSVIS